MLNTNNYPIIDSHAHIFPDKIAEKAVLSIGGYYNIAMAGKGTVEDLLESGEKINVSKYIIHSTATKADQVTSVNDFIKKISDTSDKFIGFGTLHPDFKEINSEMERILSFNFKGVKLHPEFQNFSIDDESMLPIYRSIEGKLPILIHMGDKNVDSSNPKRLLKIIEKFPDLTFIAAHLGGYHMWKESFDYLAGANVYFDTSSSLAFLAPAEALKIIKKHGTGKVLFGSDYPMWNHEEELKRFNRLDLTGEERENILWRNAVKLLDIK